MARPSLPAGVASAAARAVRRPLGRLHPGLRAPAPGAELPDCTRLQLPTPVAQQLSPDMFRGMMSTFPTAVTVVTAHDADGDPRGLTCSAVTSVSVEPPLVAVCVNRRNGSLAAIRDSGGFALNLLRRDSWRVADVFASPSPDKFRTVAWRPSRVTGLPWLAADAAALLDCRLVAEVEIATHAVLFGLVLDGSTGRDPTEPLLYWRRAYGGWAGAPAAAAATPAAAMTGTTPTTTSDGTAQRGGVPDPAMPPGPVPAQNIPDGAGPVPAQAAKTRS